MERNEDSDRFWADEQAEARVIPPRRTWSAGPAPSAAARRSSWRSSARPIRARAVPAAASGSAAARVAAFDGSPRNDYYRER